jgi:hypothetical protein
MELLPLIAAVASVFAGAWIATALLLCYLLWLRFCRYIHDAAVNRNQDPDPEKIIKAAGAWRLGPVKQFRQLIASPEASNELSTKEKAA